MDIERVRSMTLPRSNQILLKLITALTLLAICWLSFSKVDIVATAFGKVSPDGRVKHLQAAESGIIRAINVVEGQHINKADLLFEFDPTISESDSASVNLKLRLAELELDRLESELTGSAPKYEINNHQDPIIYLQKQLRNARIESHQARMSQLTLEIENLQHNLEASVLQIESLGKITQHVREQEQKLRPHIGLVVSQFFHTTQPRKKC